MGWLALKAQIICYTIGFVCNNLEILRAYYVLLQFGFTEIYSLDESIHACDAAGIEIIFSTQSIDIYEEIDRSLDDGKYAFLYLYRLLQRRHKKLILRNFS